MAVYILILSLCVLLIVLILIKRVKRLLENLLSPDFRGCREREYYDELCGKRVKTTKRWEGSIGGEDDYENNSK